MDRALQYRLTVESIQVSPHFADVLLRTSPCVLVCVDIPIGLSDGAEPRACDVAARRLLGPRASSVFPTPARACLTTTTYEEASQINFQSVGKKLSKQSFFIIDKIRQVDDLITPAMQQHVREIHPEVTFHALNNNRPAEHKKRCIPGRNERIALLANAFPAAADILGGTRKARVVEADDILDALAAAWTAAKVIIGQAATLPEHPATDRKGLRMEILRPRPPIPSFPLANFATPC
jgi:predicted RNase H-like nuclease